MRFLLLAILAGCAYTARPVDLIPNTPVYCQPYTEDLWDCTDSHGLLWRCVFGGGTWNCKLQTAPLPERI